MTSKEDVSRTATVPVRELVAPGTVRRAPERAGTAGLDFPSTSVGTSGNTTVYYANSLGDSGKNLATQLLALVDGANKKMEDYFGFSGQAVSAIVAPLSGNNDGTGGAYHYGCDFASGGELYLDSTSSLTNAANVELSLYIAELSECFMGAQNKGWGCGYSNGEGLSRVCAELATPAGSFPAWGITGPSWVSANYPDWVATTEQSDGDYASTGCAVLYIYWMISQGYTMQQVTRAAGSTLAANYRSLTGKNTAYADLKAAVQALHVTSDNPFTGVNGLWHTLRNADGTWQKYFGLIEGQEQNNPGLFTAVGAADTEAVMQCVGVVNGQVYHTLRNADGSWQKYFGLIEGQEQNNPGSFSAVDVGGTGGTLQLVGIVNGQLWHTLRNPDGSWQKSFGLVPGQPGPFAAVSCAGTFDILQVVGIVNGQLWHTLRKADGSWQPSFQLIEAQEHNNPGSFTAIGVGGNGDLLQLVGIVSGQLWHTLRLGTGKWQTTFGLIEGQEQNDPGAFTQVDVAGTGELLQVVGVVNGQLWHTIRTLDGHWQKTFGLIEGQEQNDPGAFRSVAAAGTGDTLQVIGLK